MKEELYQSMYHQIHLSDKQRNKILAGIREAENAPGAGRKSHLTLRGAICVCAVAAASCITVLAANPSYVDRIAEAIGFWGDKEEATPLENEMYAAYGTEIRDTWELESGTMRLDALLYDRGNLYIPFTVYPDAALSSGEDVTEEEWFVNMQREVSGGWNQEGQYYYFRLEKGGNSEFVQKTYLDPIVQEDGSLKGNYSLTLQWIGDGGLAQGDVIQRVKHIPFADGAIIGRMLRDGESTEGLKTYEIEIGGEMVVYVDLAPEDEVITSFRLESAPLPQREISVSGISFPYGLTADKIIISPLALYMFGTGDFNQPGAKIQYNLFVVLKDGTVVGNGTNMSISKEDESSDYMYELGMHLGHAVDLDEIAGISITDRGEEICFIPVE